MREGTNWQVLELHGFQNLGGSGGVVASNNDGYDYEPDVERKDELEPSLGISIKTIIETCLYAKV